jgi:SAM-dependent methyltransferase
VPTPPPTLPDRVRNRLRREVRRARGRAEAAWERRRSPVTAGIVERLNGKEIAGWVEVKPDAPTVRVGLWINDFEATTVATVPTDRRNTAAEIRTFRFALKDFWKYVRTTDRISVRAGGQPLPFTDRGMFYLPRNNGTAKVRELRNKLADGYVFASNGRLLLSKNRDLVWQANVMGLYNRVRAAVKEIAGYDAFLIYGSLLGAVRENGFIGHDFDFDAAYISDHRDGPAAARELAEIARALIDYGFNVESRVITLHIYDPKSAGVKIDLFHLFFDADGRLRFPWGVAGTTDFPLAKWQGTREIELGGSTGLIPLNAELMVETMYGASWRTPNSGFSWARERRDRAVEGRIPAKLGAAVNWENFYAWNRFDDPSPFLAAILERDELPRLVVDLGCGDGRDSIALARAGRRVVGIDHSEIGLRIATERAATVLGGEETPPAFVRADFDDRDELRAALAAVDRGPDGAPVLFYGRFLLHALPEDTRATLLAVLDELARPGDHLALEFRTPADEGRPKTYTLPGRFYVDPDELTAALARAGFEPLWSDTGTGLSPYQDEDPELFRLLARRTR